METVVLKAVFAAYLAVLVYFGFVCRRPNKLGWFMFCRASYVYAEIRHGAEVLNIWNYLPHSQVIVHKEMVNDLLRYLRQHHEKFPMSGVVRLYTKNGVLEYRVRNAWLV